MAAFGPVEVTDDSGENSVREGRGSSLTVMDEEWGGRSTHFQKFLSPERVRLSTPREVRKSPSALWSARQTL